MAETYIKKEIRPQCETKNQESGKNKSVREIDKDGRGRRKLNREK